MKKLLCQILAGRDLEVGEWTIYVWSDGSIGARRQNGLLAPEAVAGKRPTVAGLQRLLKWIDAVES